VSLLRRAVPVRLLEYLARTPPWPDRTRVMAAVVLNPKTPQRLSLPLIQALPWRSLADVAMSARVPNAVRLRAESVQKDRLPELRLGERITLGKLATPAVLMPLLADKDGRVLESCLQNPRLREGDLLAAIRRPEVSVELLQAVGASPRWTDNYPVRLALSLERRTPLGVVLSQLSSLTRKDLLRVSQTAGLLPLVQAAALRVAETLRPGDDTGRSRKRP